MDSTVKPASRAGVCISTVIGKDKNFHSKNLLPCTGQILSTCVVLRDAFAPAQFERARSGDKDQAEPTVLNLERGVRLKAEKIPPKIPRKIE